MDLESGNERLAAHEPSDNHDYDNLPDLAFWRPQRLARRCIASAEGRREGTSDGRDKGRGVAPATDVMLV